MRTLDTSRFVTVGEGLGAGMANFSLIEDDQRESFPAQLARQLGERFIQPLIQPPGLGDAPGFPRLPVRVPWDMQTTVLSAFPPIAPYANLSLPGLTVAGVLARRPEPPVVRPDDALQTAVNLVLGLEACAAGNASDRPNTLEYALRLNPTLALLELGFVEVLEAAVAGDVNAFPDQAAFLADYATIVQALRAAGCEVIVLTVPDPMDTAHFSTPESAGRVLKMTASAVRAAHGLQPQDRIAVKGLMEMGYQTLTGRTAPLPEGSVVAAAVASDLSARVRQLNAGLTALAGEHGAHAYDLCGFFRRVREQGAPAGERTLTADFLGGFYSLNGYYPGRTGHALIANDLVDFVNATFGTRFQHTDLPLPMFDAVVSYQAPGGPVRGTLAGGLAAAGAGLERLATMAGFGMAMVRARRRRKSPPPPPPESGSHPERWTVKLPPGLEQTLPLNKESSYYGDALRAVHTIDAQQKAFGVSGHLLFGGLCLMDSHLTGSIRIRFSPPQNDVSHFEVSIGRGLVGEDGRLSAPQFFCLPGLQHRIFEPPDFVSSGDLDLVTGSVSNLKCRFYFLNTAIFALAAVNPTLPKAPLDFPGFYGSTWARFDPRPDGLLDFTLYATTFIPLSVLGPPVRFPLPFAGPSGSVASIPGDGTALHPHIHLSTKAPEGPAPDAAVPEIPTNTVWELMASIRNNSFGDDFNLNAPELAGHGVGRSHLHARYQVQFGERSGDTVSIVVTSLPPGGLLVEIPQSPLVAPFGSRIPRGVFGHNETLRVGKLAYTIKDVSMLDDPLDVAVGVVNVKTGKVVGQLLRRGLIATSVFMALVDLEPRTPKVTFTWRGPASFEQDPSGAIVFRYAGTQYLPYPEGFKFPGPDLDRTRPIVVGANSVLWPFLRNQAMRVTGHPWIQKSGEARLVSSHDEEFSYRYAIPADRGPVAFEYTNVATGGTFRLECLTWLAYLNSRTSKAVPGDYDTVTICGLGRWSGDPANGVHALSAQICTSAERPYVSILIDGGLTSNVNTKPPKIEDTMP